LCNYVPSCSKIPETSSTKQEETVKYDKEDKTKDSKTSTEETIKDMYFKDAFIVYAAGYDENSKEECKGENVKEEVIELGDSNLSTLNNKLSEIDKDYSISPDTKFSHHRYDIQGEWVDVYNRLTPEYCLENIKDGTLCEIVEGGVCFGKEHELRIDDGKGLTENLIDENNIVGLEEILNKDGIKVLYKIESDKTESSDMGVDNLVIMTTGKSNFLIQNKNEENYNSLLEIVHELDKICGCSYEDGYLVYRVAGKAKNKPIAVNDYYEVYQGDVLIASPSITGLPGVLANDSDPDGDNLIAKLGDTSNLQGFLRVFNEGVNAGTFEYHAPDDFVGKTFYKYTLSDGCFTDGATVTINVLPKKKEIPPPPAEEDELPDFTHNDDEDQDDCWTAPQDPQTPAQDPNTGDEETSDGYPEPTDDPDSRY
jgi:hypothetical protein